MHDTQITQLTSWGLSPKAVAILLKEPEMVEDLKKIRKLPPLEQKDEFKVVEIRFDDVTYIRYERGKGVYYQPCSANFEPTFSEYKLDEETILFHVGGEVVVDRTAHLDLELIRKVFSL